MPTGSPATQFQQINEDGSITYVINGGNSPTMTFELGGLTFVLDQDTGEMTLTAPAEINLNAPAINGNGSPIGGGGSGSLPVSVGAFTGNLAAATGLSSVPLAKVTEVGPVTFDDTAGTVTIPPAATGTDVYAFTMVVTWNDSTPIPGSRYVRVFTSDPGLPPAYAAGQANVGTPTDTTGDGSWTAVFRTSGLMGSGASFSPQVNVDATDPAAINPAYDVSIIFTLFRIANVS